MAKVNGPSLEELGPPVKAFGPAMANVAMGFFIAGGGMLAALAGIIHFISAIIDAGGHLPMDSKTTTSWMSVMIVGGFCLLVMGAGVLVMWYCRRLMAGGAVVFENGLSRVRLKRVDTALWSQVAQIRQLVVLERPPVLKGVAGLLIPKVKNTSYYVKLADGRVMDFNSDSIGQLKALGELLQGEAERRQIEWIKEEQDLGI